MKEKRQIKEVESRLGPGATLPQGLPARSHTLEQPNVPYCNSLSTYQNTTPIDSYTYSSASFLQTLHSNNNIFSTPELPVHFNTTQSFIPSISASAASPYEGSQQHRSQIPYVDSSNSSLGSYAHNSPFLPHHTLFQPKPLYASPAQSIY